MRVYKTEGPEFRAYGRILEGFEVTSLLEIMETIPLPQEGVCYVASLPELEAQAAAKQLEARAYGELPTELGMCYGWNRALNCLEYHRTSEITVVLYEVILFLALETEIEAGSLPTSKVRAFQIPAGAVVELYATTLHYTPCHVDGKTGFKIAVLLPRGTNLPLNSGKEGEDRMLTACNKWLLAHPDSEEAGNGAYIGLTGENLILS